MAQAQLSLKKVGIDKTNSRIFVVTAVAAFLSVFFLVASIMLVQQMMYQNKVIGKKKQAVAQLKQNIAASTSLINSYQAFVSAPQNLIGGNPTGNGAQDGSNGKLVLDALPSKYDFPGLTSSLEKVLTDQQVKIDSISGTDDELAQSSTKANVTPTAVPMPFQFTVEGNYQSIKNVLSVLDRSIRPIQVQTTDLSGDQSNLTLKVTAQTFYQPEKSLSITQQVVK